jgi:hypothetical protein
VKERVTAIDPQDAVNYLKEVQHTGEPGRLGLNKARKALDRLRQKSPLFRTP